MGLRDVVDTLLGRTVLKGDEEVQFFPTYGRRTDDGWAVRVRGWVYEPEENSRSRRLLVGSIARTLNLDPSALETAAFRKRAWAFLVDHERNKRLSVRCGGAVHALEPSAADGHFEGTATLAAGPEGWIDFEALTAPGDARRFLGRALLLAEEGLSVVSDIDDTIKLSEVADRRALMANTFLHEFRPVPGMAEVYRRWEKAGAAFHYVSGSPWQLYPPLSEFLMASGFPLGTFHLKRFRWKSLSAKRQLSDHTATKRQAIRELFEAFPRRRFVLVGDAGERDPEIYAGLASEHPGRVERILLRDVSGEGVALERLGGLAPTLWQVFRKTDELS